MILYLKFLPEDGAAFKYWCEQEERPAPEDLGNLADAPFPPNTILMVRIEDDDDDFLALWGDFIVSAGNA